MRATLGFLRGIIDVAIVPVVFLWPLSREHWSKWRGP